MEDLLTPLREIIFNASNAVMKIYEQDFSVYEKEDKSPLTEADLEANKIITDGLQKISEYPILSEEGKNIPWIERKKWHRYWLVDPIDGTKEFIKKNDEFTINIALIENGAPILGVVAAPALEKLYVGIIDKGASVYDNFVEHREIKVSAVPEHGWRVVGSRSHNSEEAMELANSLPGSEFVSMGSSLKLCAVAEGSADIYPRFGLTSEWDTAAAQAIVEAAGGQVITTGLRPLRYNTKESLLNPFFIVCSEVHPLWADTAAKLLSNGQGS
jgi:3'(2'), 5'-bisphosphate nucleotidase